MKEVKKNLERLLHVEKNGHLLLLKNEGRTVGYAELYVMKNAPSYPAVPYPRNEDQGTLLYCFAAVCERGFIQRLIKMAFDTFPEINEIVYHRRKHDNKLYKIARQHVYR